jgi:hypothetical protein
MSVALGFCIPPQPVDGARPTNTPTLTSAQAERAQRRYEQAKPRTAVQFDPKRAPLAANGKVTGMAGRELP